MRRTLFAALILALLLAAGCGGQQAARAPNSTPQPAPSASGLPRPAASLAPSETPAPSAPPPSPTAPPTTPTLSAPPPALDEVIASLGGLPVDEFFEQSYRRLLLRNPEGLTSLGISEAFGLRDDRLNDLSPAFQRETLALQAAILDLLRGYDRAALTPLQQSSYDVYEWWLDDKVRGGPFLEHGYLLYPMLGSYDVELIRLFTELHPLADAGDVGDYLARLSQVDEQAAQVLEGLARREALGAVPPRYLLEEALSNLRAVADAPPAATPFYTALRQKVADMSGVSDAERAAWLAAAEAEIGHSVQPAFAALAGVVQRELVLAGDEAGVWRLPNGDAYYAYLLRRETSTELTPQQVHDLGLAEVARIQAEMRALFDELGYPAGESGPALMLRAMQEGGFLDTANAGGKEALVQAYRAILDEADAHLDAAFDLRPTAELVVVPDPAAGAAFYVFGSLDGTRPGAFHTGTGGQPTPKLIMRATAYHEGVPGHHFQTSLAGELGLPLLRADLFFNGYVEGWALYAEGLAGELGLYPDVYSRLGRLNLELLRAARLVADTGIHYKRWTRAEAHAWMSRILVRGAEEVDRYSMWPAQATGYKVGELKILELRARAQEALGERFDLKAFHRVLLGEGAMPLGVLERRVEAYIAGGG